MTEDFDDKPFDRIYEILEGIEYRQPVITDIEVEKIDDPRKRRQTIRVAMNYVEQARRFLRGAEAHDSGEAYQMADDSIDDLQQNMQILAPGYPDTVEKISGLVDEIWEEKRRVYDELKTDPDGIIDREYNNTLIDIRAGLIESAKDDKSVLVENPYQRTRYYRE